MIMSHPKAHKITFSLRDQLSKLQTIFSCEELIHESKVLNYVQVFSYIREYELMSQGVTFGLRIEKDDKNANGIIQLTLQKKILADRALLDKLSIRYADNPFAKTSELIFVAETQPLSYQDAKKVLSKMVEHPRAMDALNALNETGVFDLDLKVLFLSPDEFVDSVLEKNKNAIIKMKALSKDVVKELKILEKMGNNPNLDHKMDFYIDSYACWTKRLLEENKELNELTCCRKVARLLKELMKCHILQSLSLEYTEKEIESLIFGFENSFSMLTMRS